MRFDGDFLSNFGLGAKRKQTCKQ